MANDPENPERLEDLEIPFLFVPHGAPEPAVWMARHPGWAKIPATFVPRDPTAGRGAAGVVPVTAVTSSAASDVFAGRAEPPALRLASADGVLGIEVGWIAAAAGIYFLLKKMETPESEGIHPGWPAAPTETLTPPPPTAPVPGLVPPPANGGKPGEGGFTPSPPMPPLPGFTPSPPQSHVLAGPAIEEHGPIVFQRRDRNAGLPGELRTFSPRARVAAGEVDATVTKSLRALEWKAHHLVNMATIRAEATFFAEAARAGWRTDETENIVALPASEEARQKLQKAGIRRPVHNSGHPEWNADVLEEVNAIMADLQSRDLQMGSEAYARAAKAELESMQRRLRQKMLGQDRITQDMAQTKTKFI